MNLPVFSVTWRVIASHLEQQIKGRERAPGDRLPTEMALSRQFMVNRHTVRRALAHLQAKGLVESTQGRGSFVRRRALRIPIGRRTRFTDNVVHLGAAPSSETLALEIRPAESAVAEALGLRFGAPVIYLERLAMADGEPIGIGRHHFSRDVFPNFIPMYLERRSISRTLADLGVPDYVRSRTRVLARLPSAEEARLLDMPRHVPLLVTQSLNRDGAGRPVEYGEARSASDRIEFEFVEQSVRPYGVSEE
jgi:GntR family transcriptional regulator, phosphonate transport system regulatory protein